MRTRRIAVLSILLTSLPFLASCPDDGAEDAGEAVDEAVEDAGDAIDDAADEVEDAVDGH